MLKDLIKLASHLDRKGLLKEADALDGVIAKLAQARPATKKSIRDLSSILFDVVNGIRSASHGQKLPTEFKFLSDFKVPMNSMFEEFCRNLSGDYTQAYTNWAEFANKSNGQYTPDISGMYSFIRNHYSEALDNASIKSGAKSPSQVAEETPFTAPSAEKSVAYTYEDVLKSRGPNFGQTGPAKLSDIAASVKRPFGRD